jgi:hypothetical protein
MNNIIKNNNGENKINAQYNLEILKIFEHPIINNIRELITHKIPPIKGIAFKRKLEPTA